MAQGASLQLISGTVPPEIQNLGLQPVGQLPPSQTLSLAIGLPPRNSEELDRLFADVSDPASPNFRHYITYGEFTDMFGPTDGDYQSVIDFARAHGLAVTQTYPNRVLVDVQGSVSDIENALHVHLLVYNHPTEGRTFYAPDAEPSIDLATPVMSIAGLTDFVKPQPMTRPVLGSGTPHELTGSGPSGSYMGSDFRRAYVPGTALTGTGQKVGLLQFDSGFYQSDITAYETLAGIPNIPITPVLLDGYSGGPGSGNVEVSLDIEMAISMGPGLSEVRVYEGSITDDILNAMAADTSVKQFGASWTYGIDGTSNTIWRQMGVQGQSFYNASGDGDAYVGSGVPTPCDDPYLMSVGGTTLFMTAGGAAYTSERAWNWTHQGQNGTGTGGGIGRYTIPSWQVGIDMTQNLGSTTKRNVPDIAMTADNVYVKYGHGASGIEGGTSCATPLWASFTSLVNQEARSMSLPTMGFINPALYALGMGQASTCYFHDITVYDNTWSSSPSHYFAVTGYDLCTGWGTPTVNLPDGLVGNANPCTPADVANGSPLMSDGAIVLPNPARGMCSVSFDCPSAGPVHITVLDVNGRVVRNLLDGPLTAGRHTIAWDGRDGAGRTLANGVYITRVQAGPLVRIGKAVLAR